MDSNKEKIKVTALNIHIKIFARAIKNDIK